MTMQTKVIHNAEEQRYEIWADDDLAGITEYHPYRGTLAFIHTEVDGEFEGKGLGSTLVRGALDEVRSRGESVLPFCPFVRGYIKKHREYVDLVPADDRDSFGL
jgi:predicted GNAT family acetyltransferase